MRVDDLRIERDDEWIEVSARLSWEDCDRPAGRISFKVDESLAHDVECDPNAFLVATAAPAMFYGERRIAIDGRLCPVLHDGVLSVLTQLREWYDKTRVIPAIEPSRGFATRTPRTPGRAAQFFSGGVDALTTFRRNRLIYPSGHPASVKDAFYVFGVHPFDYQDGSPSPSRFAAWEQAGRPLQSFANAQGVDLHRFCTNLNAIFDDENFGDQEYFSAILFSLAHLLAHRVSDVFIASSDCIADLGPYGSHPLIDPYYASSAMHIQHDCIRCNRLEKVRILAEWPKALAVLNVCINQNYTGESVNCGYCRKCVRTMIELLICGCLDKATTFPTHDLNAETVAKMRLRNEHDARYLRECLPQLLLLGRRDLAEAIKHNIAKCEQRMRQRQRPGVKQLVKRFDERFTGGWLRRLARKHGSRTS